MRVTNVTNAPITFRYGPVGEQGDSVKVDPGEEKLLDCPTGAAFIEADLQMGNKRANVPCDTPIQLSASNILVGWKAVEGYAPSKDKTSNKSTWYTIGLIVLLILIVLIIVSLK